jgi:uncharacterized protein YacL
MTAIQKIIVGAIGALVVLLLMLIWAFFVYFGKTPIDPFINQIGALITIVVGLIAAFFGHQSGAASRPPAPDVLPGVAANTANAVQASLADPAAAEPQQTTH